MYFLIQLVQVIHVHSTYSSIKSEKTVVEDNETEERKLGTDTIVSHKDTGELTPSF